MTQEPRPTPCERLTIIREATDDRGAVARDERTCKVIPLCYMCGRPADEHFPDEPKATTSQPPPRTLTAEQVERARMLLTRYDMLVGRHGDVSATAIVDLLREVVGDD